MGLPPRRCELNPEHIQTKSIIIAVTMAFHVTKRLAGFLPRRSVRFFSSADAENDILCNIDEDSGVATLTINRPKALNALNTSVILQLRDFYNELAGDSRVRCLVLTGSEKAFAAGADIKEVHRHNAIA